MHRHRPSGQRLPDRHRGRDSDERSAWRLVSGIAGWAEPGHEKETEARKRTDRQAKTRMI